MTATGRKNLIMAASQWKSAWLIQRCGPDAATREMTVVQGVTPVAWLMVPADLRRD